MNSSLKIPQVTGYIEHLGRVKYRQIDVSYTYDAKSYELLDELFALLQRIEPIGKNNVWGLWLSAERGTIEDYGDYEELRDFGEVDSYEEFEQRWKDEYPDETEWFYFQAVYEEDIDYRAVFLHHKFVLEQDPRKERGYEHDVSAFVQWLVDGVKTTLLELEAGTYNARLQKELPPYHRTGTVLRKYEWEAYPDVQDTIIGNLTKEDLDYFMKNATSAVPDDFRLSQVTANDFYRYCAMGYKACDYKRSHYPPKEQYYRNADGRDDGLRDIDPNSPEVFEAWYTSNERHGGHPWEVCRGGNSTHIDLYVCRDTKGWYLRVAGSAWTRCAEAAQFFITLHRAGLPVCIYQAEILKSRFRGDEKIGIVPAGVFPAYCESYFPDEDIIDFSNLPFDQEAIDKLLPHCIWQPIEEVKLRNENGKNE